VASRRNRLDQPDGVEIDSDCTACASGEKKVAQPGPMLPKE